MPQYWFHFHAGDYLLDDDVFNIPPEAEALLVRMWCLCCRDGYAPTDPESLALKIRRPVKYVAKYLPVVLPFFIDANAYANGVRPCIDFASGRAVSERMESERSSIEKTSVSRSGAAKSRWDKQKAVRELLAKDANAYPNAMHPEPEPEPEEKQSPSDSCSEVPTAPSEPAVAHLPCVGTGPHLFPVTESLIAEWSEAYPGIDVRDEVRRAIQWCRDNPKRKKTYDGARKFLGGWLSRAQNHARPQRPPSRTVEQIDAEIAAIRERAYPDPIIGEARKRLERLIAERDAVAAAAMPSARVRTG